MNACAKKNKMCAKEKYYASARGGILWLCGSQDGARPAAGHRLRLLLPLVVLLPRLLVLAIVPRSVAADPAALPLAAGHGLPPILCGVPFVLGHSAVKSLLDRRHLTMAGIIVGEECWIC